MQTTAGIDCKDRKRRSSRSRTLQARQSFHILIFSITDAYAQDALGAYGSGTHLDAHIDADLGANLDDDDERHHFDSIEESCRLHLRRRVNPMFPIFILISWSLLPPHDAHCAAPA